MQAQQVARSELAATDLDEQIGPARQEAPVATEARAELDRLAHRRRLVIVEAHAPHYAPLRRPLKRVLTTLRRYRQSLPHQLTVRRPAGGAMRPLRELGQPFHALADHLGWPSRALSSGAPCHHPSSPFQGGQAMRIRLRSGMPVVAIFTLVLVLLATAGPAAAQGKPIRIGEINSYSGLATVYTFPYKEGLADGGQGDQRRRRRAGPADRVHLPRRQAQARRGGEGRAGAGGAGEGRLPGRLHLERRGAGHLGVRQGGQDPLLRHALPDVAPDLGRRSQVRRPHHQQREPVRPGPGQEGVHAAVQEVGAHLSRTTSTGTTSGRSSSRT